VRGMPKPPAKRLPGVLHRHVTALRHIDNVEEKRGRTYIEVLYACEPGASGTCRVRPSKKSCGRNNEIIVQIPCLREVCRDR